MALRSTVPRPWRPKNQVFGSHISAVFEDPICGRCCHKNPATPPETPLHNNAWEGLKLKRSTCNATRRLYIYIYTAYIYIVHPYKHFIYIYICWYSCEVIIWSKFGPFGSYYLVQVCFFSKTPIAKKHYKNRGFSPFFWKKNCAQKFWKLLSGPSWRFLRRSQLGPDNNFQLGPDNNFQKCLFFVIFCFEKCAKMPIFIVFFEKQPKNCPKNCQKKTITFHILQNTGS